MHWLFITLLLAGGCGRISFDKQSVVDAALADIADAALADAPVSIVPDAMEGCLVGGAEVGTFCWYMGANNESCDTVCALQSLVTADATRSYAGSDGTDENCNAVLDAFGISNAEFMQGGAGYGGGCTYNQNIDSRIRWIEPETLASAQDAVNAPACACE